MDNPNKEAGLMITNSSNQFLPALLTGNNAQVSNELAVYKERGTVVYEKVLKIPKEERIPELVKTKEGRLQVLTAITASLKSAFANIYLKNKPSEDQLVDLADKIIDESYADYLSIQDILLFLQQLLVGKMGKLFDRLDMPTFFEKFEIYRQQRHEEILKYRDELGSRFTSMGRLDLNKSPFKQDETIDAKTMLELMQTYYEEKK